MLFKTIAEIRPFWPVTLSDDFNLIKPFIKKAERDYIIPSISQAEYDALDAAYNVVTPTLTAAQTNLLEKIREALALYSFCLWIPSGQLQISDSGIRIANNDQLKTAFQWQIKELEASTLNLAGSAMDALLVFLETNKADYSDWAASSSYTEYKELFIPNAIEFTKLYSPLGNSRLNFLAVRSQVKKIEEFVIKAELSEAYYDELKTQINAGTVSANNAKIVDRVKKIVANLAMAESFTSLPVSIGPNGVLSFNNTGSSQVLEQKQPAGPSTILKLEMQAKKDGLAYLQEMKNFLSANIADYATYASSTAYNAETTDSFLTNEDTQEGYVTML